MSPKEDYIKKLIGRCAQALTGKFDADTINILMTLFERLARASYKKGSIDAIFCVTDFCLEKCNEINKTIGDY